MARGAGGSPGRVNGRFLLLTLICAIISAVLVYAAIGRNKGGSETAVAESTTETVVAKMDIPARTQITSTMLTVKDVPINSRLPNAAGSVDDVVGKISRYPIYMDEQVTSNKVVEIGGAESADSLAFSVAEGKRAISISADQVVSAGGLVLPGDHVDIMAVLNGKKADGSDVENYVVKTILQDIQVLAVAQTIADSTTDATGAKKSDAKANPEATTLTLLVTPEQSETLFLAELNGTLRAVVRGFGDAKTNQLDPIYQNDLVPPAP
jgi:pilus assembly protein CpaB